MYWVSPKIESATDYRGLSVHNPAFLLHHAVGICAPTVTIKRHSDDIVLAAVDSYECERDQSKWG